MRRATLADLQQVNEWAGGNFSGFLSDELNVCLIEGSGGAFFVWRGPGIYETHLFMAQRGKEAISTLRRMIAELADSYGATTLWAAIPVEARNVIMFARLMGWKSRGRLTFPHGNCEIFILENAQCPQR